MCFKYNLPENCFYNKTSGKGNWNWKFIFSIYFTVTVDLEDPKICMLNYLPLDHAVTIIDNETFFVLRRRSISFLLISFIALYIKLLISFQEFLPQSCDDGYLEVIGLTSKSMVSLLKICSCHW